MARQRKQRYEFGRNKGKYIITTSPFEDVHIVWWIWPSHYCTPNSVSWKSDYIAEFPTREEAIAHIQTLTTKQQTLF